MKQAFYIRCRAWAFLCVVMEDEINHQIDTRLKHTASETANAKDDRCPSPIFREPPVAPFSFFLSA
jgi:hypothetical protein